MIPEAEGSGPILVVGGAGFIGGNLCHRLAGRTLFVVDNLLSGDRSNLPDHPGLNFIEGSITDAAVLAEIPRNVECVFHLATFHGNQNSVADPQADFANNLESSFRLFHHLSHGDFPKLSRVVYSGAGCVVAEKTYGLAQATQEDAAVSLQHDTPYQVSKLVGEMYAALYHARFGLPVVTARFQNVYGPGEILGAGQWRGTEATVWRNVVPTFIYKALSGAPLSVENGGIATRDFIYVADVVDGLLACAQRGKAGETYNLASGEETRIFDLAQRINALCENSTPLALTPARDWDRSGCRYGATEKSAEALGFRATTSLAEGLEQTVAWTRRNFSEITRHMATHSHRLGA